MITGKELFGEIKHKNPLHFSRRSIFSESSLGALWDHDTNDAKLRVCIPSEEASEI